MCIRDSTCDAPLDVKVYTSYLMLHRYELLAISDNLTELGIKRIRRVGHHTMFNGTDEDLRQTKVTQPAVFLHSVISALCMGDDFKPETTAGHSLGEFSALVAAGAPSFEDGPKLVYARAMAMQNACEAQPSTRCV